MLEPLGVAMHAVDLAKPALLERVAMLGGGTIGQLILQVLKAAGAGEILLYDPLASPRHGRGDRRRDRVGEASPTSSRIRRRCSLVLEATNSPLGFRDAV